MHKVYHGIERIAGNVITVQATGVGYRELAQVTSRQGSSLAQVIRLEGGRVDLQVFAGGRGIATDAEIRFLGHTTVSYTHLDVYKRQGVQKQFFPAASRPELLVDLWLANGSSLKATEAQARKVEALLGEPEMARAIRYYASYLGNGSPRFYLPLDQQLLSLIHI